ncbi:MAG: hypothetical protein H0T49_07910 [Chloroflexia bacterium]|nr:hypothetical protein [Chloroflexia bacterium]
MAHSPSRRYSPDEVAARISPLVLDLTDVAPVLGTYFKFRRMFASSLHLAAKANRVVT